MSSSDSLNEFLEQAKTIIAENNGVTRESLTLIADAASSAGVTADELEAASDYLGLKKSHVRKIVNAAGLASEEDDSYDDARRGGGKWLVLGSLFFLLVGLVGGAGAFVAVTPGAKEKLEAVFFKGKGKKQVKSTTKVAAANPKGKSRDDTQKPQPVDEPGGKSQQPNTGSQPQPPVSNPPQNSNPPSGTNPPAKTGGGNSPPTKPQNPPSGFPTEPKKPKEEPKKPTDPTTPEPPSPPPQPQVDPQVASLKEVAASLLKMTKPAGGPEAVLKRTMNLTFASTLAAALATKNQALFEKLSSNPPKITQYIEEVRPKEPEPPEPSTPGGGQNPGGFGGNPGAFGGNPGGAFGGNPGAFGGNPGAFGGNPGAFGGNPGAFGGNPGAFGGNPGAFGGQPGGLRGNPGAFGGQPGALRGNPGAFGGNPGAFGGQPGGLRGNPGAFGGNPGAFGGQPGGGVLGNPGGAFGGNPGAFGGQPGAGMAGVLGNPGGAFGGNPGAFGGNPGGLTGNPGGQPGVPQQPAGPKLSNEELTGMALRELARNGKMVYRVQAIHFLAKQSEAKDLPMHAAEDLAKHLLTANNAEFKFIKPVLFDLGRFRNLWLALADEIDLQDKISPSRTGEVLGAMLNQEIKLGTDKSWRSKAKKIAFQRALVMGTPSWAGDAIQLVFRDLYRDQATCLGVKLAGDESRATEILKKMLLDVAAQIPRDKLTPEDRQFVENVPHWVAVADFLAANDLQRLAALERSWLKLLAIRAKMAAPAQRNQIEAIVASLADAHRRSPDLVDQIWSAERHILQMWMLYLDRAVMTAQR